MVAALASRFPRRGYIAIVSFVLLRGVLMELPQLLHAYAMTCALGIEVGAVTAVGALRPVMPVVVAILIGGWLIAMRLPATLGDDRRHEIAHDVAAYAAVPFLMVQLFATPLLRTKLLRETTYTIAIVVAILVGLSLAWRALAAFRAPSLPSVTPARALLAIPLFAFLLLALNILPSMREIAMYSTQLLKVNLHKDAPAPDFTLPALDGPPVHLLALKGKPVVLAFWATWCPVCKQELPAIEELAKTHTVYAISTDDTRDTLAAFARATNMHTPILLDESDNGVAALYNVSSIPNVVLIAPDGTVAKTFLGLTRQSAIEDAIASLPK